MKLACCIFIYYPFGGLQRDFLRIAKAFAARGHSVTVFTSGWEGERPEQLAIQLIEVSAYGNPQRMRAFSEKLQPLVKGFDSVLGFNRMPGLDFFFAGESCYVAGIDRKKSRWFKWTSRYKIYKALEAGVYGVGSHTQALLLSPSERELILQYYPQAKNRLHLLPPGIEANRIPLENQAFIRESLRAQLGIQGFMLLMIGSDFRRKGVDRAIQAVASLPEHLKHQMQLVVIGHGDKKPYLRLAISLGVEQQIKFLGTCTNAPEYLLAADLLLHPAKEEAAGMVLVEALVAGLPMIVTASCGYAYLVKDAQAGRLLSAPFSQADFNQQLAACLQEDLRRYRQHIADYRASHDLRGLEQAVVNIIEGR
jgi:UDP-glucose:(heptosyl)LPS alpha-1,3-glucosyltransferase